MDDLFGNSERLILSDHGEDKGRSGWGRLVVRDRIMDAIAAAVPPAMTVDDARLSEIQRLLTDHKTHLEETDQTHWTRDGVRHENELYVRTVAALDWINRPHGHC